MRFISWVLINLLVLSSLATAQTNRNLEREKPTGSQAERRIALVIGNGGYAKAKPLPNPANDAADMAKVLKGVGFEVLSGVDLNKRQMENLIREFGAKLASGGTGLFYYAGHGVQVNGENFLVPVDAEIPQEDEVKYAAVSLGLVLDKMTSAKNDLNIVILDACRNNPFARSWRGFRDTGNNDGLAKISPPTGTLVLYATEPGKVASDGAGRNGLFTEALLKQIKRANIEYDQMVKALSADVWQRSNRQQLPWKEGNSLQDFYFTKNSEKTSGSISKIDKAQPDFAQQHFQKGNEYNINGDKESAAAEYRKAVEIEPSRATYQYSLGYALISLGKNIEAEPYLREAVRLAPQDAQYRYYLAFCLRVTKRLDEAEKQIREAVRLAPQKAEYQFELGSAFYSLGRLDETEAAYQEAVRLQPENDFYFSNLNVVKAKNKSNSLEKINRSNDGSVDKTDQKPKIQTAKEHFFTFNLLKCGISGSTVACDLLITNNESSERPLNFYYLDFGPISKIFDDQGNETKISDNKIANRGNYETATMLPDVAVKARAVFNNVSAYAKELELVTLYFATVKNGFIVDSFKIEFKNVSLVK